MSDQDKVHVRIKASDLRKGDELLTTAGVYELVASAQHIGSVVQVHRMISVAHEIVYGANADVEVRRAASVARAEVEIRGCAKHEWDGPDCPGCAASVHPLPTAKTVEALGKVLTLPVPRAVKMLEVSKDMVTHLRDVLGMAERGELKSLLLLRVNRDPQTGEDACAVYTGGLSGVELVGWIEIVKHDLFDHRE